MVPVEGVEAFDKNVIKTSLFVFRNGYFPIIFL
jgi:hypothetical protein